MRPTHSTTVAALNSYESASPPMCSPCSLLSFSVVSSLHAFSASSRTQAGGQCSNITTPHHLPLALRVHSRGVEDVGGLEDAGDKRGLAGIVAGCGQYHQGAVVGGEGRREN